MIMSGRIISTIFGKGWRFPGIGPRHTPWSFDNDLEPFMAPLGLSFSLLIEAQVLIKVNLSEKSWAHLILISLCCVLGLCHSFKSWLYHFPSCYTPTDKGGCQKMGNGPISGKSHSFPKISGILISLISL